MSVRRGDLVHCPECNEAVPAVINAGYAKRQLIVANHEPPGWPGYVCSGSYTSANVCERAVAKAPTVTPESLG